jgi:hypothetical protein
LVSGQRFSKNKMAGLSPAIAFLSKTDLASAARRSAPRSRPGARSSHSTPAPSTP